MGRKIKNLDFEESQEYYKEAVRYFQNARGTLKKVKIKYDRYQDLKPVREACGTAYLAVLTAFNGYFIRRGIEKDKLLTSADGYWALMKKNFVHNGKIKSAFSGVYEILHVTGCYRGTGEVKIIKPAFDRAKMIIETLSGKKI